MACEHLLLAHPHVKDSERPYTCPQCHYSNSVAGFVRLHAVVAHQGMDDGDVVMNDANWSASSVLTSSNSDVDMDNTDSEHVDMDDASMADDISNANLYEADDMSDANLYEHVDGHMMPVPGVPAEIIGAFRTFLPGFGFGTFIPEFCLPVQPSSENDDESLSTPLAQLHINSSPFRCTECLLRPVNGRWCEEHNRN